MRKRRKLADKLTIMVCAVLVAVSAFFYAPMDVEASNFSFSDSFNISSYSNNHLKITKHNVYLVDSSFDLDSYYVFDISYDFNFEFNTLNACRNFGLVIGSESPSNVFNGVLIDFSILPSSSSSSSSFSDCSFTGTRRVVCKASDLYKKSVLADCRFEYVSSSNPSSVSCSYNISIDNYSKLSVDDSSSYESGYNDGYLAGEQVGESNGYSNGYSDGFEAGEQSGYDSGYDAGVQDGFQSGQGSVDTQSYYDAGYNAGYDSGYLEGYSEGYNLGYDEGFLAGEAVGYEKGYESGWQAYEDKISGWGADTSDYPVYITSSSSESGFLSGYVYGNSQVYDEESIILNFDINPNHIYRFDVKLGYPQQTSYSNVYGFYTAVYFCAGGVDYFISPTVNFGEGIYKSIYVRGDMLSSAFSKKGVVNVVSSSVTNPGMPASYSFTGFWHDVQVYDVGPIGNMQNHIANQTDQLTGGYNDSQGNSVNNDFSTGLNEFETAEDSLFATATTGMKDFAFFDISSVPAMLTGMSFVGSVMTGWFNQAGGASGVGIVLSILFSIMLVAMVLGLYRWYQSKGGKD